MHQLVPDFILRRCTSGDDTGSLSAAALFADISGFSAMTDKLMTHGQHGAEVLATVMRAVFDPLVESVYEQEGFVATLAGDAMMALFPAGGDQIAASAAKRALAAAWAIQGRLADISRQSTNYGLFEIRIKVGLDTGRVDWGIVGTSDGQRMAYYFKGIPIDGSAEAEKKAGAGDIITTPLFYEQIADIAAGEPVDEKWRITSLAGELPAPQPLERPAIDVNLMARFFPREIVNQRQGGEFRHSVNLFISLPTVRTEDQLAIFIQTLFSLQDRYGGLFNRLDFGDKGVHLLLFWGAPLAFENDIDRALNFILDLQTQTAVPISAGISYHIAHAGLIGGRLREEYTCYGRGVNLAARFMTAAPRGEIWVDERIARRAGERFEIEFVERKTFKGFAQEQEVYTLFERRETDINFYQGEMIGRTAELAQLADFVAPIFSGQFPGALVISGEAGSGKSRLAYEFFNRGKPGRGEDRAEAPRVFFCQTDEILRESLNPFRYWLKRHFGLSEGLAEYRNKRAFNRHLDRLIGACTDDYLASELDRTRSFLGALVDLHWPDSLYEQLDGQSRYENTFNALLALLRVESRQHPLILLIEDSHWLDDDSRAFLVRLSDSLAFEPDPLAILATARSESTGMPLSDTLSCQQIDLGGLSRKGLASLGSSLLGGPLAPDLIDLLANKSEGNPFFGEQILRYMKEASMLVRGQEGWQTTVAGDHLLPADVRTMLVARLDRLTRSVREAVQTAAVVGREFEVRLLTQMLQKRPLDMLPMIEEGEKRAVWSTLNQIRYIFNHALLRDAAYRMQVRARREALHALALESIEGLYANDLRPHYGELAYHAEQARLVEKALAYLLSAGDEASRNYANTEAIAYYDRALEIGGPDQLTDLQLTHLYLNRGRALEHIGQHEQALGQYKELLRHANDRENKPVQLAGLVAIGTLRSINTSSVFDPAKAKKIINQSLVLARSLEDKAAEAKIYWQLMHLNEHLGEAGSSERAIEYGESSVALARELDLKEQVALTLNNLWMAYTGVRQVSKAIATVAEAQRIFRETGNLPMLADAYNGSAGLLHAIGKYEAALAEARRGSKLAASIGNVWNQVYAANIIGLTYLETGEIGQAIAELKSPRRLEEIAQLKLLKIYNNVSLAETLLEVGDMDGAFPLIETLSDVTPHLPSFLQYWSIGMQARFNLLRGNTKLARQLLQELPGVLDKYTYLYAAFASRTVLVEIEVALALGEHHQAEKMAGELVDVAERTGFRFFSPAANYLQAQAQLQLGDGEAAEQALKRAYEEASAIGNRRTRWKILAAQAELAEETAEAKRLMSQARNILVDIGDKAGTPERQALFVALPAVREVMEMTRSED